MKRTIRKVLAHLPIFILEYFEWLFSDAAENQLRISKSRDNRFRSFTQLKKYQMKLKIFLALFFLALFFLLTGLVIGPIFFPRQAETELYIPNGRGDILLGNISKNQATVIFKTLDGANGNKPLATSATVEVFDDSNYSKLVRRSVEDDYAVTHIIPIDSLQEGNIYYLRITAKDASTPGRTKSVSAWGDGNDQLKFYTTGELIPTCATAREVQYTASAGSDKSLAARDEKNSAPAVKTEAVAMDNGDSEGAGQADDLVFQIGNVTNENYLQPKNKVQTIISWDTNIPATTVLIYSEGNSKEKKEIILNEKLTTRHAAVLTTLKAGMTYYFSAKSVDAKGGVATSKEHSLRTPRPQSTVAEKIVESIRSIFQQIKPR